MVRRSVRPEWLEALPHDHPAALRSRQDLGLVNGIMGNHRWIARMLRRHSRPGWEIMELGAGDGTLSLSLMRQGLCHAADLHGVDLAPRPSAWPAEARWTQGDLFAHPLPCAQVLVANLLLHHFEAPALAALGARISPETRLILAAEPARYSRHAWAGRLFCSLAELNAVTCHDMQVSIRAGFRAQELPEMLGLEEASWEIHVHESVLGGYRLRAVRRTDRP